MERRQHRGGHTNSLCRRSWCFGRACSASPPESLSPDPHTPLRTCTQTLPENLGPAEGTSGFPVLHPLPHGTTASPRRGSGRTGIPQLLGADSLAPWPGLSAVCVGHLKALRSSARLFKQLH